MAAHIGYRGDGVRDVAFTVEDARLVWKVAIENGGKSVREPWEECDENGKVVFASIKTYGNNDYDLIKRRYNPYICGKEEL